MRLRRYLRVVYGLVGGRCSHLYPPDIGEPPCGEPKVWSDSDLGSVQCDIRFSWYSENVLSNDVTKNYMARCV
jgi:hypothetical protein